MNIRLGGIILMVMVAMILSACGGGSSGESGFGTYVYEDEGVKVEYMIPAPEGNTLVAAAETYRAETGAGAASYILASLDNSEGSEEENIPDMRLMIITKKGDTLKTKLAWEAPDGVAAPGESTTTLLMTDEPIPSMKSVFVEPFMVGTYRLGAAGAIKLEKVR